MNLLLYILAGAGLIVLTMVMLGAMSQRRQEEEAAPEASQAKEWPARAARSPRQTESASNKEAA